jgi:hypothetical protein
LQATFLQHGVRNGAYQNEPHGAAHSGTRHGKPCARAPRRQPQRAALLHPPLTFNFSNPTSPPRSRLALTASADEFLQQLHSILPPTSSCPTMTINVAFVILALLYFSLHSPFQVPIHNKHSSATCRNVSFLGRTYHRFFSLLANMSMRCDGTKKMFDLFALDCCTAAVAATA